MAVSQIGKLLIRLTKYSGKISKVIDATNVFNSKGWYVQDLSGWDNAVVQTVGPLTDGPISFYTTNDDNSVTGLLLPAPEDVNNWNPVLGTNLSDLSTSLTTIGGEMYEFGIIGKYLILGGDLQNGNWSLWYLPIQGNSNSSVAIQQNISNGSRVVYLPSSGDINGSYFYYDSLLTQRVYGVGSSEWFYISNALGDSHYLLYIQPDGQIVLD